MRNRVLIFPSGAENALEINEAIKHSLHVEVIPASGRDDYSSLIYENEVRKLPYITDAEFITKLNELVNTENIKLIFPTDDTAALFLMNNQDQIKAKIISADAFTNEICRYKSKTYELFKDSFFCPEVYTDLINDDRYPIFSKPDVGQGAQGVQVVKTKKQHEDLINDRNLLFVELLPGKEFTVDCFTNKEGELLFSGMRERAEIKMGISFRCIEAAFDSTVKEIAEIINQKLKFRGLWFFQLKEDSNGNLKLLEISTRTAGTMGFFRHKGVNLPLLSVYDALDMNVSIHENNYTVELFRSTKNRYKYSITYENVYIDYDDTIIINNKVNITLMSFIYQCKNNNKKVILITKHGNTLHHSLESFGISSKLFDEIIVLKLEDKKSDYINPIDSIFIDNWFIERREVNNKHNIPVFDVDIVESLIIK